MTRYCKQYFYPEHYPDGINCPYGKHVRQGECTHKDYCIYHLDMNKAEHAILDNLRIIQAQNKEILSRLTGKTK